LKFQDIFIFIVGKKKKKKKKQKKHKKKKKKKNIHQEDAKMIKVLQYVF
jgi:hypothetical protein